MLNRNDLIRQRAGLKLGLFGANCSSGRTYTTASERWISTWENNIQLAKTADALGFECLVPIARWKGYGGETNPNGSSWESITWAAGMLSVTKSINVFATVHVPLIHPIVAAKQMATVDQLGSGRFGVNVVCGWNDDEFEMFGVTKKEHDGRYEQGEEWWNVVTRIWAGEPPFDFNGNHYQLRAVEGAPQPFGGGQPLMMNAGTSPSGRAFALRFSDLHFDAVRSPEESSARISEAKDRAALAGRSLQVWTPIGVICRPSRQEAADFMQHVVDYADVDAIGNIVELIDRNARNREDDDSAFRHMGEGPLERRVLARGNFCVVGDPDHVADQLERLHGAGFDGLVLNFVNYLDDIDYFGQEVFPRLESKGIRATEG